MLSFYVINYIYFYLEIKPDLLSNILNKQNWYLLNTTNTFSVINLIERIEFLSSKTDWKINLT
jgi:hypothetical protein